MAEANATTNPLAFGATAPFITPLNLILITAFLTLLYTRFFKPATPAVLPPAPAPILYRIFTPPELLPYNGADGQPVYFAVRHVARGAQPRAEDKVQVFDVSAGRNFYGPGGPYSNFAGRDASRGLACGSFDEDMLTKDLHGPLDLMRDLGPEEMEGLKGWEERFEEKYLVVGELVPVGHEKAEKAQEAATS